MEEIETRKNIRKNVVIGLSTVALTLVLFLVADKSIEIYQHYKKHAAAQVQKTNDKRFTKKARELSNMSGLTEEEVAVVTQPTPRDIKWARAQGRIKTITIETPGNGNYYEDKKFYQFDRDGVLVSVDNGEYIIERDEQGRISKIYCYISTDCGIVTVGDSYEYDEQGFVISEYHCGFEWGDDIHYTNNRNGWCVSARAQGMADCDNTPRKYTFSYSDIDSNGNWHVQHTKAIWLRETEPYVEEFTTARAITYWDER